MTTTTTLKRSLKRLHDAAAEGGWDVDIDRPPGSLEMVRLTMTLPPLDDSIPEPSEHDFRARRYLAAVKVVVSGAADTGAFWGVAALDADGDSVGHLGLDTVTDVEKLLSFRKRYVEGLAAAEERKAAEEIRHAERVARREAYLERIADDYRLRALTALAESTPEAPNLASDGRSHYWAAGTATNYFAEVIAKSMAKRTLDIVGWPERDGDEPMSLGAAAAKAVSEVLGHERGGASTDNAALVEAARKVLNLAT